MHHIRSLTYGEMVCGTAEYTENYSVSDVLYIAQSRYPAGGKVCEACLQLLICYLKDFKAKHGVSSDT